MNYSEQVAQIILEQLGGKRFIAMTGASNLRILMMKVRADYVFVCRLILQ